MENTKTVRVNPDTIKKIHTGPHGRKSEYRLHVLRYGHEPGVLSGNELRGKARAYGAKYARQRNFVEAVLRESGYVGECRAKVPVRSVHGSCVREARVWTDITGAPVRLVCD